MQYVPVQALKEFVDKLAQAGNGDVLIQFGQTAVFPMSKTHVYRIADMGDGRLQIASSEPVVEEKVDDYLMSLVAKGVRG